MQKISGIKISKEIISRLKKTAVPARGMVAVLIGDDSISANFVNEKKKVAGELGVKFDIVNLPKTLGKDAVKSEIDKLSKDQNIGGLIIQLPVPANINRHEILKDIPAEKDVDVLGEEAVASYYVKEAGVLPPSAGVIDEIISALSLDLSKMKVAIVGMGLLVGKPIAIYLMHRAKSVELLDTKSEINDVAGADMIISGVGKAKLIDPKVIKPGAIVIDFGYDYSEGRLVGDFDHSLDDSDEARLDHIKYYTPTPGGTGPILVAKLFENFYRLNKYE